MVSLAAVETLVAGLWPDAPARRRELARSAQGRATRPRHRQAATPSKERPCCAHARREGFPELWVPQAILVVAAVPVLGTGKVDLPATATELARHARPLL